MLDRTSYKGKQYMEENRKENREEDKTGIPQEDIQKPSVNPFRSDVLKSILFTVFATVGIGLLCRFTEIEKASYFKGAAFLIEGNLALKLVKDLRNYYGYKSYRKNTDHDVSRTFYLNEMQRIEEMRAAEIEKKRK